MQPRSGRLLVSRSVNMPHPCCKAFVLGKSLTIMAKLTNIAPELILMIATHIPRSADKLNLICANQQMYHIFVPELYRYIVLDQGRDPSIIAESTFTDGNSCWDTIRLRRLCSCLEDAPLSDKPAVESLSLELDSNTLHESFACSDLTRYLPKLKHLCLSSQRSTGHGARQQKWSLISPSQIQRRLRGLSETLESLIIDIDQDASLQDASSIGISFFKALKNLSIQSHILLGEEVDDHLKVDQNYGGPVSYPNRTMLSSFIPANLQKLQISCLPFLSEEEGGQNWAIVVAVLLEDMMKYALFSLPKLRHITVYYPAKEHENSGVGDNAANTMAEEDERGGEEAKFKPECREYARKGQWQEVARILMESASENRTVSVKYVPVSQRNGCSSSPLFQEEKSFFDGSR